MGFCIGACVFTSLFGLALLWLAVRDARREAEVADLRCAFEQLYETNPSLKRPSSPAAYADFGTAPADTTPGAVADDSELTRQLAKNVAAIKLAKNADASKPTGVAARGDSDRKPNSAPPNRLLRNGTGEQQRPLM